MKTSITVYLNWVSMECQIFIIIGQLAPGTDLIFLKEINLHENGEC